MQRRYSLLMAGPQITVYQRKMQVCQSTEDKQNPPVQHLPLIKM